MSTESGEQLSFLDNPTVENSAKQRAVEPSSAAERPVERSYDTPMLRQYLEYKRKFTEHLLLFQVGDFYEIFFDDAKTAADVLNIRLTSRDKSNPDPTPMCGVPIHAIDNYIGKLLSAGYSCVLVSQVEEDAGKKNVRREVSRVITPGIRYDGLEEHSANYVGAAAFRFQSGSVVVADVSTGAFKVQECEQEEELLEALDRFRPVELILPSTFAGVPVEKSIPWYRGIKKFCDERQIKVLHRPFEDYGRNIFTERLGEFRTAIPSELTLTRESIAVSMALLSYVGEISFNQLPQLASPRIESRKDAVVIDAATRRNLELFETRIDGERRNSLLGRIDCTRTAMGGRLLREWILSPSRNLTEIEQRHEAVQTLKDSPATLQTLRQEFLKVRDLERILARVVTGRVTPRDLAMLRDSIEPLPLIKSLVADLTGELLQQLYQRLDPLEDLAARLHSALVEEPPVKISEGNIFRSGFSPELDELRSIRSDGNNWLLQLEQKYRDETGIPSLKVRYNNVFGYFIEVSKAHLAKVPSGFERRQTLVNAERFISPELKQFESKILSAKDRQHELERELFVSLRSEVLSFEQRIRATASVLSELDLLAAFAEAADRYGYSRPRFGAEGELKILAGRHPVVEQLIGAHNFVANDAYLNRDGRRFAVLTGPNMGGKSTYLKQVGLIQILAQAGSFVPAAEATLSIVDRIFTRIGSADDLSRGDSTFMVEMREAATIIRRATKSSLVLIDEIGRGTATADGLAIATAIAEWLHDISGCITIFATHFHELTELAARHHGAFCLCVGVVERDGEIEFTHRIEEHASDKSYGIEVARLAGLPEQLLRRAKEIFAAYEDSEKVLKEKIVVEGDSSVKAAVATRYSQDELVREEAIKQLLAVDTNRITPIDALQLVSRLQGKINEKITQ